MQVTNLKIGMRLAIAFILVLTLTAVMTLVGIWRLQEMNAAAAEMDESALKERITAQWYLGNVANAIRTTARAKTANSDDEKFFLAEMTAQSAEISKSQKELESLIKSDKGKQLMSTVSGKRKEYMDIRNEVFKLKAQATPESEVLYKNMIVAKMNPAMDVYNKAIQDVVAFQKLTFDTSKAKSDALFVSARNFLSWLGLLAIAAGAVLAWLLSRSIIRPLTYAVTVARTVAAGDFTTKIEVSSKDETGQLLQALKDMNSGLVNIVAQVRSGTDTIATASAEIASGNMDLSSRTEQQASSLEETASSMEELTSTVKQNADNARQANQLAVSASGVAIKGGNVVSQVVTTMESINDSAKKIADIIGVIDGIAFQTNILALNAAVEAARAGEQGRGFAVVASEVRNLAQRSAAAAKEIKTLIGDSVEKVDAGSKLVSEAGATMDEIVDSVKRVTDIMAEIMVASEEQSSGIEQVNQAIGQMDQVTQQNAALVEEAAAAAESLQEQAGNLAKVVSVFKLDNSQMNAVATPAQRSSPKAGTSALANKPRAAASRTAISKAAPRKQLAATTTAANGEWEEF